MVNNDSFSVKKNPNEKQPLPFNLVKVEPIHRKVWVLDQGDHVMILYPEDY